MSLSYKFPKIYDFVNQHLFVYPEHSPFHQKMMAALALDKLPTDSLILDVACGSGELTLLLAQKRPDCRVVGVDVAEELLSLATRKAQARQLDNIHFIRKSALTLSVADIQACCHLDNAVQPPFALITCAYGYTAMPYAEDIFQHTLSLLQSGGTYFIEDVYYPQRTLATNFFAKMIDPLLYSADMFRKPFLFLQKALTDFCIYENPTKLYGFLPAVDYVARGVKRSS